MVEAKMRNCAHQEWNRDKMLKINILTSLPNSSVAVVSSSKPFHVLHATNEFASLFGYAPEEICGRCLKFLQGPATNPQAFEELFSALKNSLPCEVAISAYRKDGICVKINLQLAPASLASVAKDSLSSQCLVIVEEIDENPSRQDSSDLNLSRNSTESSGRNFQESTVNPAAETSSVSTPPSHNSLVESRDRRHSPSSPKRPNLFDETRNALSRITCQICKTILAAERQHISCDTPWGVGEGGGVTGPVPLELVARCARDALTSLRSLCCVSGDRVTGGWNPVRLGLASRLVHEEVLPQCARWHRRDLAPALAAAWRAVLRALAPFIPREGAAAANSAPTSPALARAPEAAVFSAARASP